MKTRSYLILALLLAAAVMVSLQTATAQGSEESDCPAMMGGSIRGYVYGRIYDHGVPVQAGLEVIAIDDSGYIIGCGETLDYGILPMMTIYQSGREDYGVEFFVGRKFFFSNPTIGGWWGNMKELRLTLSTEQPQGLPDFTAALPTTTLTQTQDILIPLTVSSTVSAKLFAGEIDFDPQVLEFLGIESGSILPRSAGVAFNDTLVTEGKIVFYGGGADRFLLSGELLQLKFRAIETGQSILHVESFVTDASAGTELINGGIIVTAEAVDNGGTVLFLPAVLDD